MISIELMRTFVTFLSQEQISSENEGAVEEIEADVSVAHPPLLATTTPLIKKYRLQSQKWFSPLTGPLFWRKISTTPFSALLRQYPDWKNKEDGYGKTPLRVALEQANFQAVLQLMDQNVVPTVDDRAYFQMLLQEECEQDPDRFLKWRASLPVALHAAAEPLASPAQKHYELPAVKRFGLTLGLSAQTIEGTYTEYSFLGEPFALLAHQLNSFNEALQQNPVKGVSESFKQHYTVLSEAFDFSEKACGILKNTPDPLAASRLLKRFSQGKPTIVPCGARGHAMSVALVNGMLVFTNRGAGGDPEHGIQIYALKNPTSIDESFFKNLLNGSKDRRSFEDVLKVLEAVIDPEPAFSLKTKKLKRNSCAFSNPKSSIEGILLVQEATRRGLNLRSLDSKIAHDLIREVHAAYKPMPRHLRNALVDELVEKIKFSNRSSDINLYCQLVKAYIQEHHDPKRDEGDESNRIYKLLRAVPDSRRMELIDELSPSARFSAILVHRALALQEHYAAHALPHQQENQWTACYNTKRLENAGRPFTQLHPRPSAPVLRESHSETAETATVDSGLDRLETLFEKAKAINQASHLEKSMEMA